MLSSYCCNWRVRWRKQHCPNPRRRIGLVNFPFNSDAPQAALGEARVQRQPSAKSNTEWQRVTPFPHTNPARVRFLSDDEAVRLVKACPHNLRLLVRAALLTGARFGDLKRLQVRDVNLSTRHVYISPDTKSERARHVLLNDKELAFFRNETLGKVGDHLVFPEHGNTPWGKNHHTRPLKAACAAAKMTPPMVFHELRHTYASHLAQAGVEIHTISKLLGHSSVVITARFYAHLCDRTLANAVTKLPNFDIGGKPTLTAVTTHLRPAA